MSTDQSPQKEDRPAPRSRRRQLAVVSVAAAVLVAGGGGAYWASTASSDDADGSDSAAPAGNPPKLALDGTAASAHEDEGIAPGEPMGPRGYRAEGELPGGPDSAAVRTTGHEVRKAQVAKLAEALEIKGAVKADDGRWRAGGSRQGKGPRLTVDRGEDGGAWTYQNGDTVPLDADASPEADPAPDGKPLSPKEAKDAVRPALRALGLGDAGLDAGSSVGGTRTVTASPKVDGLPTHGWDSTFVVDDDGAVTRAQGSWNRTGKGETYPVMSATATLDQLNKASQSRGGHGAGAGKKDEPTAVGDATFGLSLERSHGEPLLVPAWIYEVKRPGGGDMEVTHPALDPKYLKPAETSGHQPSQPGKGSSHPGREEGEGDPGKGDLGTGAGKGSAQAVESYSAEGRTLKLRFWGGVCDTYKATADESGSSVKVKIDAKPKKKDRVCVKIAKRQTVEVELDKKLGDRTVVDARDGEKLPHK
ncbi:hypothetical protein [Streptomyces sp. PU-14G]|uniref:hypothetical protein n=1 Tax=Streptomyces sp. PU-14G TaxID=2800808 RepID=UPI0034DFB3FF